MTSSPEASLVAVDDFGSPEAFLAAVDATIKYFNDGDIVTGTVVKVDRDEVLLDIGYKTEGVIPSKELSIKHDVDPFDVVQVGDLVRYSRQWFPVRRANKKTVQVGNWLGVATLTFNIPWTKITGHKPAAKEKP